jgi:hypothetical protein
VDFTRDNNPGDEVAGFTITEPTAENVLGELLSTLEALDKVLPEGMARDAVEGTFMPHGIGGTARGAREALDGLNNPA